MNLRSISPTMVSLRRGSADGAEDVQQCELSQIRVDNELG